MTQPAPLAHVGETAFVPLPHASEQLRRRRAADEILIAAIFGLSECEEFDPAAAVAAPRRSAPDPRRD